MDSTIKGEEVLKEHLHAASAYGEVDKLESMSADEGVWEGVAYTEKDGKNARRKVDICIVGTLTLYYFLSYLDRSNVGNAKVAGMTTDLGMTGNDYNLALTTYFLPYILFELPCAMLLKMVGPHILLPTLVTLWGVVTMSQAWVHSYGALLACRFFLGALEAGLTPCSVILMACYVRRYDIQKRIAVFFAMISLSGAFAGLIAYGITSSISGARGYAGWRWIFLIEGVVTVFFPLVTFYLLPASPRKAWWLSPSEKAALLGGLAADNTTYTEAHEEKGTLTKGLRVFVSNPIVPLYLWNSLIAGFFTNGLPFYIPPVIAGFNYTPVRAQLFTVPPYVAGFFIALISAYCGDKFRARLPLIAATGLFGFIGYIVLLTTNITEYQTRYGGLFIVIAGSGFLASAISAWIVSNVTPHSRRAPVIAAGYMLSNTCGLIAVWSFREADAPVYRGGTIFGEIASIITLITPIISWIVIRTVNRKRERRMAELPSDHVYPAGPIADTDLRWRFRV